MVLICAAGHCKQQKPKTWTPGEVLQESPNRQLEQYHAARLPWNQPLRVIMYVNHGFWQISAVLASSEVPSSSEEEPHFDSTKTVKSFVGDTIPCLTAVHTLSVTVQFAIQPDRKITIAPGHHLFHPGVCVLLGLLRKMEGVVWCLGFYLVSEWLDTRVLCQVVMWHDAPFWNMVKHLSVFVPKTNTPFSPEITVWVSLDLAEGCVFSWWKELLPREIRDSFREPLPLGVITLHRDPTFVTSRNKSEHLANFRKIQKPTGLQGSQAGWSCPGFLYSNVWASRRHAVKENDFPETCMDPHLKMTKIDISVIT